MVCSLRRSVSIYNNNNFRESALPNLTFYYGKTEFQKLLNMVGTCEKYRCFIVSECMRFLFIKQRARNRQVYVYTMSG